MKKIKFILFSIFTFIFLPSSVFASSGSINVTASSTNIKVGDTVTVTTTFRADEGIGGYYMSLAPSNTSVLSPNTQLTLNGLVSGNPKIYSNDITFKAISAGSCSFKVHVLDNGEFVDTNGNEINYSFSSVTINVSEATYSDIQNRSSSTTTTKKNNTTTSNNSNDEEKSDNNYLKDLTIEGIELLPTFSKEEQNYSIEIDKDTKEITINAVAEDNNAEIEGIGKVNVNIGDKLEVVVTAPSGERRTYIINVVEKDNSEKITVKVNGKEYTIVTNKDLLTKPDNFKETTIKINGKEVPAFINKKANITLVGLKDSKGKINLYIYKNKKYTLFKQLQNYNLNISVLNYNKKLYGFTKSTIKINKKEYPCYVYNKNKNIIILYGTNLKTGKNGFYQYDKELDTLINYNKNIINDLNLFKIIGLVATIAFAVSLIFNIVMLIENKKIKKRKNNS